MSYDTVATISQVASLLLFIALFIGVVIYVLLPKTKQKLEQAQYRALDLDTNPDQNKGQ